MHNYCTKEQKHAHKVSTQRTQYPWIPGHNMTPSPQDLDITTTRYHMKSMSPNTSISINMYMKTLRAKHELNNAIHEFPRIRH